VKAVPVKNEHTLFLSWPIKPELRCYKEAPSQYVGHLLGHEAEGSLFAVLKKIGKQYHYASGVETLQS
jgi:insulysin